MSAFYSNYKTVVVVVVVSLILILITVVVEPNPLILRPPSPALFSCSLSPVFLNPIGTRKASCSASGAICSSIVGITAGIHILFWTIIFMYVCMYVWSSHIAEYGSTG